MQLVPAQYLGIGLKYGQKNVVSCFRLSKRVTKETICEKTHCELKQNLSQTTGGSSALCEPLQCFLLYNESIMKPSICRSLVRN